MVKSVNLTACLRCQLIPQWTTISCFKSTYPLALTGSAWLATTARSYPPMSDLDWKPLEDFGTSRPVQSPISGNAADWPPGPGQQFPVADLTAAGPFFISFLDQHTPVTEL
jgi:hypothetical protein